MAATVSSADGKAGLPGGDARRLGVGVGARLSRIARRGTRLAAARARARPGLLLAASLAVSLAALLCVWAGAAPAGPRPPLLPAEPPGADAEDVALLGPSAGDAVRRAAAAAAARNATAPTLGNRFCVMQPTLSAGRETWAEQDAREHIALRAFLRTFTDTVTEEEKRHMRFAIYYGHDSDDPVFGDATLRAAFETAARERLRSRGFEDAKAELVFTPLYGLHGRVNAIWNTMVKDAYYDGCDYFFMSNDDMVFFTKGWVTSAVQSLDGIGSPVGKKRACRYFGTVRFKDEWASWATFTFHVSTRLHVEIFGGTYYPVPYNSAHNDYWIHYVYKGFESSKYRGEVKVRNRVDDVDFALANQKDTKHVAPPRYEYDKKGDVTKYIQQGRARVRQWLDENRDTGRCLPPL